MLLDPSLSARDSEMVICHFISVLWISFRYFMTLMGWSILMYPSKSNVDVHRPSTRIWTCVHCGWPCFAVVQEARNFCPRASKQLDKFKTFVVTFTWNVSVNSFWESLQVLDCCQSISESPFPNASPTFCLGEGPNLAKQIEFGFYATKYKNNIFIWISSR